MTMRQILAFAMFILRRIAARKAVLVLALLGVFVVWDLAVRFRVEGDDGVITSIELDGKPTTRLHLKDSYLIDWLTLSVLGVLIVAPVVPSMMRRGYIEPMHALPLSRSGMLIAHSVAGVSAYTQVMVIPFLLVFVLQGVLSSNWNEALLFFVIPVTVMAICVTCYLVLFGVLFNSTSMGLLVTWLYVFLIPVFLQNRERALYRVTESETVRRWIDIAYYILPQVPDMHTKGLSLLFHEDWKILPFGLSLATAIPALVFAIVVFRRKSF
jgi:ABC-type transport system involved in multi-copper enzyme maturation permease subunit